MSLPDISSFPITQGPLYRRDKICPENYSLCPEASGGGCCPNDRSCGTDSCYATTDAPMSVCSKNGMVPCGIDQGGGCCPSGHSCVGIGCAPVSGSQSTMSCSVGSYLCPEAVAGFGACCKSGLGCGKGYCYETTFPTVVLTQTSIFRDSDEKLTTTTATITTAYQPSTIPTIATTSGPTRIIIQETAIPKISPVDTEPRTGMSKGTMNGIIAGAVVALVLVLLGAWLVIRKLNSLARSRELESFQGPSSGHKHNLSGDSGNSGLSGGGEMTSAGHHQRPLHGSGSIISVDPLFMASGSSTPRLPRPSLSHGNSTDTDIYGYGSSPPPIPAPYIWNQGYSHVTNNEESSFAQSKHTSLDSGGGVGTYSPAYNGPASEVSRDSFLRDQNLRFGRDSSHRESLARSHGRQWSDASDMSNASNNSSSPPTELDGRRVSVGNPDSEVGMSPGSAMPGRPSVEGRSRSWTFMNTGGHRKRSGIGFTLNTFAHSPSAPPSGGGRLAGVAEADTDGSHATALLGKSKKKEGRPRAATKGSDTSIVAGRVQQSRSQSEGMIPQIMYTHQAESHSLPAVPDSPSMMRAVPQFAGPLSPHSSGHPPLEWSSNNMAVAARGGTTVSGRELQNTQGDETYDDRDKKEVMVHTREIDPSDP